MGRFCFVDTIQYIREYKGFVFGASTTHSIGGEIAGWGRWEQEMATKEHHFMNTTTTALPAVSRACRIQWSGLSTEAETTTHADRFRQDHPPQMLPSAGWNEFLTLDEMCDRYIRWMLDRCGGNRVAAAKFLGIGRTTLYRYLKEHDRDVVQIQIRSRD